MITDKQLAANRANAQKSTGPQTPEGKKRSSLNATRHGLTGQVVVLPEEDLEAFNQFILALVESFDTANVMERQLAQSYANYQWRINRAAAIEENMFTFGNIIGVAENLNLENPQVHNAMCNARTFRDDALEFGRLATYTQRLVSQAETVLKQLKQFQAERRDREQREMVEAINIYQAHRTAGEPFDPKANGFVLTIAKIEAHLRRERLADVVFIANEAARNRQKAA